MRRSTAGKNMAFGVAAAALLASGAHASDGVQEINAACAASTGCFPGDAAGYPVTLSAAAGLSYRLAESLTTSLGDTNLDLVEIGIDGVHLDLNGFMIRGASVPGSGRGVVGLGPNQAARATISNGTIRGMGNFGIDMENVPDATLDRVVVEGNGAGGARLGERALVRDSRFVDNDGSGLDAGVGALVRGNTFEGNGDASIQVGLQSIVEGSTVRASGVLSASAHGIQALSSSRVVGNTVLSARGDGISTGGSSVIEGNTVQTTDGASSITCVFRCSVRHNIVADRKNKPRLRRHRYLGN